MVSFPRMLLRGEGEGRVTRLSLLAGEQDALAEERESGASFDRAGAPGHGQAVGDGVEVSSGLLVNDAMPGSPPSRAAAIHSERSWPVWSVIRAAEAWTWLGAAWPGHNGRVTGRTGYPFEPKSIARL